MEKNKISKGTPALPPVEEHDESSHVDDSSDDGNTNRQTSLIVDATNAVEIPHMIWVLELQKFEPE